MHVNNFAFLSLYSSPLPLVPLILSCPDVVLSEFQDFDLEKSGDPSNPEAVLSSVTRLHGSTGMAHFNLHLLRHNKHPVQQFRLITFHFTPLLHIFPTITLKNQLDTTVVIYVIHSPCLPLKSQNLSLTNFGQGDDSVQSTSGFTGSASTKWF